MDIPAQQLVQKLYFDILLYGAILVLLRNCLSSFFSGIGQTRVVMFSALTAMLVNVCQLRADLRPPRLPRPGNPRGGLRHPLRQPVRAAGAAGRLSGANQSQGVRVALPRYDGEVMRKLLRFGYPAGVELFLNLLAFTSMILLFHSHGLATATAVTIVFNWDMVSFVPLLGIQIGVVSLVGRYMGAGRPEIAERVTRSGLKMGWSYSSVIWSSSSASPNNWSRSFSPAARTLSFRGGSSRRRHATTGRPLRPGRRDDGGLQRRPARRGYLLDHVHLGRIALASAASALHPLKILQLSPQTALAGAGYPLPFLQRRFLPALPQRPLEDPDGGGREADRVAGIRRRGFRICAAIGTAGPP